MTTDLREIRTAIKQALTRRQEVPDERWALLPLVPLVPKWLFKRMLRVATGSATTAYRPTSVRSARTQPARRHRRRLLRHEVAVPGHDQRDDAPYRWSAGLLSGRTHGQVFVSVVAYELGRPTRMTNCGRLFHVP